MDPDAPRSGRVDVTLRDGRTVSHFTRFPPGTKENPLTTDAVNEKARSLIEPVLGPAKTTAIIRAVSTLEEVPNVRDLRPLFTQ
jgi:2-methylcitrate dehydratase PrpD